MSLKEQITEDMKAAMRAKDSGRLATIRLLTAAIKQRKLMSVLMSLMSRYSPSSKK